jgi:myo-inositol-1(or 4)-monophosphatase
MNLEKICAAACEVAIRAGRFIAEERKKFDLNEVVNKGQRDLVSYVDVQSEKILVEGLRKIVPEAGFLTEEQTVQDDQRRLRWIIDPLDGTTNFIHGVPAYSVSIALEENGELLTGIVYEVNLGECFFAWKGGGAYCNGSPIHVTQTLQVKTALIATGFPYKEFAEMNRFFSSLKFLFNNSHGVRRLGSAALDLVYVACGRFDGFFEYSLNAWDVAGGALIVQEAGGKVTDFKGGDGFLFGKEIIASNSFIHDELTRVVVHPPQQEGNS